MINYVICRSIETGKIKKLEQYDNEKASKEHLQEVITFNALANRENDNIFSLVENSETKDILNHVFERQIYDNQFDCNLRKTLKEPVERAISELNDLLHDVTFNLEDNDG